VAVDLAPPDVVTPRQNQAGLLILKGDFERAIQAYEEMRPSITSGIMASNLGTAYFFSGRDDAYDKAEIYYRLAIELDPEFPAVQGNLGDLLIKTGRREEGLTRYRRALEIIDRQIGDRVDYTDPNFEKWRPLAVQKAFYTAKAEDCTSAVKQAEDLRDSLPPRKRDLHDLAYVFALCNEPDTAIETLAQAIELGASRRLIAQEDEFRALRDLPEFQHLVAGSESDN
jgi:tetratricopeptide (TPR) repeat protein